LKQNSASLASPGSLIDPRPLSPYADGFLNAQTLSYLLTTHAPLAEALVLLFSAALAARYFYLRKRNGSPDNRIDAAFLATITLTMAYHRYYDAQLLLLAIPVVALFWQTGRVRMAWALALCLAAVAFPLQSLFAKHVEPTAAHLSLLQVVLFRHQPAAILGMALLLSFASNARE
jgi:hypothetical protein